MIFPDTNVVNTTYIGDIKTEIGEIYKLSVIFEKQSNNSESSYSFQLTNTNRKTVFIKTIEPLVSETMKNRILSKDIVVTVNKNIEPNETTQISGIIIVDTKGLFIHDIGKFVTDIKISTEETVSIK